MASSASLDKIIWVVASVSKRNGSRSWSFWDSKKKAVESVYGWSGDGSFYTDGGYFDYIVVESLTLNHPLALGNSSKRKWFKLRYDPKTQKTPIVPCREPSYWKRVVGFHSDVYPGYDTPLRFGAIDAILNAIGFEEKAGKYSYSSKDRYNAVPGLLREMGFEKMAKTVEDKCKKDALKMYQFKKKLK